jgi:hypothetical protein
MKKFALTLPGQFGGGNSAYYLSPLGRQLNKILKANMCGSYLKTVEEFCIILRVSGPLADFKGDGPEVLRHIKKSRYIKIDLVIPESKWLDRSKESIKQTYSDGIRQCFYLLVERAEKNGELIDRQGLIDDFEKSMTLFQNEKILSEREINPQLYELIESVRSKN